MLLYKGVKNIRGAKYLKECSLEGDVKKIRIQYFLNSNSIISKLTTFGKYGGLAAEQNLCFKQNYSFYTADIDS